jgi:hypothetical protein
VVHGPVPLTYAHRGLGPRGWPDGLGGWTAPPPHLRASPLGARWPVPPPRWEEVSERVITVYESVLRDDRAGEWPVPSRSVPRFRGPARTVRGEGPDEAPASPGDGATCSARRHPAHRGGRGGERAPLSGDNLVVANSRLIATSLLSLRSQVPPRPRSVSSSTSGALGEHRVEHRQMR